MRVNPWRLSAALAAALVLAAGLPFPATAQTPARPTGVAQPEILPLEQVKPGMKGVARTIFAGSEVETIEVEVIGVVPNLVGPQQHIIVVRLKGPKVEYTGVVGGMSGSPVYIEGKLVGALAYRFGIFAKEPLAGVTPIQHILEAEATGAEPAQKAEAGTDPEPAVEAAGLGPTVVAGEFGRRLGLSDGVTMMPIETPLVFSGFHRATIERFAPQLTSQGMVAAQGGSVAAQPDDAQIQPGDMVGMVLLQGDLTISGGCTVTTVVGDRVFVCGHPLLAQGRVEMPLARGHVLTTLASSLASTKLMNTGGAIGTVFQDRWTSVVGRLGAAPKLIPVELKFLTPAGEKQYRFEMIESPKFTPLLMGIAVFNGLVANPVYSEGMTFQLSGEIDVRGHSKVSLENMFAPTDAPVPDAGSVAGSVQSVFARIFNNPYERAKIERVTLRVESVPERRWATIESAWSEKSEVSPGETIHIKVLLRPYRGAPVIREVPITIPAQAAKGPLRILVSESEALNRQSRLFSTGPQARLPGLEQLITLLNRERRNNRLYVTLLQPNPTLLLEDKELPNAPLSQINVLDQRRAPGSSLLLRESSGGEWSVAMNQVISGQYFLNITVR